MSSRLQLLLPMLLLLAALSWWLAQESAKQLPKGPAQHVPDFFTEQMETIEMDEKGQPDRRLLSNKTIRYLDDETTELEQMKLILYQDQDPPWTLEAKRGWLSKDRKEAWLREDVVIDRQAAEGIRPYHMTTTELHLRREPDYAETERPVTLISEQSRMESIGMQAWLEPEVRVHLNARVRGHHEQSGTDSGKKTDTSR